jgi:predicted TIM-barrel fold metal-dependent hydrolase
VGEQFGANTMLSHTFSHPVEQMLAAASFCGGGILARHPDLRVAFLESGGDWLPWMVQRLNRYRGVTMFHGVPPVSKHAMEEYLRRGNVYLTIEGEELLAPQVIELLGEDHVMASADIPHPEGRENCLSEVRERQDLSEAVKEKILSINPAAFYGLPRRALVNRAAARAAG